MNLPDDDSGVCLMCGAPCHKFDQFCSDCMDSVIASDPGEKTASRRRRKTAGDIGAGGWPLIYSPDSRFPDEPSLSCPACGSIQVSLSGSNLGSDVVNNHNYGTITCRDCGEHSSWLIAATTGSRKTAGIYDYPEGSTSVCRKCGLPILLDQREGGGPGKDWGARPEDWVGNGGIGMDYGCEESDDDFGWEGEGNSHLPGDVSPPKTASRNPFGAKRSYRKTAMPNPTDFGVNVGDILVSSWGYDQTNIDFYEVTGLTGASVRVRPIQSRIVGPEGVPQEQVEPVKGAYTGPEMTKRVRQSFDDYAITVGYGQYAWPYDGRPRYQTGYGYGH